MAATQPLRLVRPTPLARGRCKCSAAVPLVFGRQRLPLLVAFPRGSGSGASCSAVQESSAAAAATTVSEKKDAADDKKEATAEAKPAASKPAAKPKKPPVKALPEMMQEEIIPPLMAALEAEDDVSQVELSFQDNRLEGSFVKDDVPYYFWAFFPNGDLTGPKGFALSSYATEVSTIEPFLIDEKRANAKYVVFWVYKRLAGQGILPVWKEEEGEGEGESAE
ncbi:uncharacterized protein LOC102703323 [Oryza brachyantha]|uniref:Uncharacterized protein n=1 Tax=Oryza brachyantha TaxID=4533 RepID=J3MMV3_ORYBR|nr:uncharacterized protein LOC102703323 [Oryza brachyantha]